MSVVFPIAAISASFFGFAFAVAAALVNAIVNVIVWTFTYILLTLQFLYSLSQNRKVAAVIIIGAVVSVLVGSAAVSDTNLVLRPVDFVFEGPVRQVTEIGSKLVMINVIGAWDSIAPAYNTVIEYLYERFLLWLQDLENLYNIIAATGDYFQILTGVRDLWDFVKSFLGYFWMGKSPGGKTEFFNEIFDLAGQFFQFPTLAGGSNRYETDPDFGAFPRVDVSGPLYYLRNFLLDAVEVVRTLGDIIITKISELSFPGQKFVPSFYVRISSGDSFWRQVADWLTKVLSLVTGESFYPKEFTVAQVEAQLNPESVQPKRFNKQKYTARILRILAQIPRVITLITAHATTIRFPYPIGAVAGTAIELIKIKLIGVPGVDLFLDPALTAVTNPIILSKHIYPCRILNDLADIDLVAAVSCNVVGEIFKGTWPSADNDIPGSAYSCILWNGQFAPLENERINYAYEAYQIVLDIAQLIEDPNGVETSARLEADEFFFGVISPIFDLIYAYAEFIVAGVYQPICNYAASAFNLSRFVQVSLVEVIEYFYRPLKCEDGVITADVDPLTCFITINSRSNGGNGFWGALCGVLEGVSAFVRPPPSYACAKRKRSLASEQFAARELPKWGYSEYAKLTAMSWSSETRKALESVSYCVFSENSTAAQTCSQNVCSYSPCLEKTLDCVSERLPRENRWHALLDTRNNTSVLFRNVISLSANFFDLLRGCSDSFVVRAYKSMKSTTDFVRSFFGRWTLLALDYIPAYFTCMEKLRANESIVDYNAEFAYCIGLTSRPPPKEERKRSFAERLNETEPTGEMAEQSFDWHAVLNQNGIYENSSWCARKLHRTGIVIDDVQIEESLSFEHFVQRACSFQLAFGTRARLADTTSHSLSDFIGGWSGPVALLNSMNKFDETAHLLKLEAHIPPEMPHLEIRESAFNSTENGAPADSLAVLIDSLQRIMPAADLFSAMFNYYADLHDVVAVSDTSPEEKQEMDQRLLLHHLGLRRASMQKRSAFARNGKAYKTIDKSTAKRQSSLINNLDERKRNFANAAKKIDSHISALQEFGRHVYWAGRYPMATAMDQQEDVPFEFSIDRRLQKYRADPILSIRVKRVDEITGAPLDDPASQTLWHNVPLSEVGVLLDALSTEFEGNSQQRQLILSAQSAFNMMRDALQPRDQYVAAAWNVRSARAAINYGSIVFTNLARIANRRLRIDGLPAFHAGSLFLSVLSGSKAEMRRFPEWIGGKTSYLQGVGFVSNDVFAQYIENTQEERERAVALYSATPYGESRDVSLFSVRRARILYAEAQLRLKQKISTLQLNGDDLISGFARQRATALSKVLKRHSRYAHYAAFLVRHELHGSDQSLHLIAPDTWSMRMQAALANTTESRQRFSISASLQSGDFLGAIDEFLELFGAAPDTLQTALVQLETAIVDFFTTTFDAAFLQNLATQITNYLQSIACDVPQDVRITGTGFYKLFCLPYANEKLFTWHEFFPLTRNKNILGYFEDDGRIHWPTAMVAIPCPSERDPIAQCPQNPPPPLFLQNPQTVPLDQAETPNGANVETYPIDTNSFLGNVCVTDWCLVDSTNRPFCPTFDYCERTYFPVQTFGFETGFENLAVWLNDARAIYQNLVSVDALTDVRFWALALLFPLLAFSEYVFYPLLIVTIPAPAAAYLTAIVLILAEFFILQRPEVYALVLIYFWIWLETLPLLAWIQWVPLIVHLYGLHYFGGSFLQPLFDFLPNLFPDELAIATFNFLGSLTFLNFLFDVSFFTNVASQISTLTTQFPATELNNVMAILSFWNFELLLIEIAVILYGSVYLVGVALYFLVGLFPILASLSAVTTAISQFFTGLIVVDNAAAVGELEEETVIRLRRLERDTIARDAIASQKIDEIERKTSMK